MTVATQDDQRFIEQLTWGYTPLVQKLLDAGCQVDLRNQSETTGDVDETPLHCAAFWDRIEIAKLLIQRGADVNARSDSGFTPLHDAARLGNVDMIRLLVKSGAEVDAKDNEGKTLLDWARDKQQVGRALGF